jgi:N-acetylglucosaminyl-diphospho-decaprenol L-rhamnosyltransferase
MMAAPQMAVVVVSYNTRDDLVACLRSLSLVTCPVEVVVVDNASRDGSAAAARGERPDAKVLENRTNEGFGRACNQGWRASSAPLVLFLNSDAEVTAGAVEALCAVLEARPEVGIVGPRTVGEDGRVQLSTGPALEPLAEWKQRRLVRGLRQRRPEALAEAEAIAAHEHEPVWVSGSCLLARRQALEAVQGFDDRFFLYEEDVDLCVRARAAGWRLVFTPAATVRHRLGRSMARSEGRAELEYHRSHLLYYRKHNGLLATALLRLLLAARGAALLGAGRPLGPALLKLAFRGR